MRFDAFSKIINAINSFALPGLEAQMLMAPPFREALLKQSVSHRANAKLAAVMALFYPNKQGETHLMFIVRKSSPGVHSGQIGFPGGKPESGDVDLKATAVRETWEEIGVSSQSIHVLCPLTEVYIPPSNFNVFPFVGMSTSTPNFKRQPSEVESIIEILLKDILDDSKRVFSLVSTSYGPKVNVPAFNFEGHIVWGATAMILMEIIELLNSILKK